jgi:hypothetical protein
MPDFDTMWNVGVDAFEQLWSFVTVSLTVYYLGEVSKRIATARGWRGTKEHPSLYDSLLPVTPIFAGALLMQIPFPVLNVIDALGKSDGWAVEAAARLGWGGLAGCLCGQVFETSQAFKRFLLARLGVAGSTTPSKPPEDPQ